jgi:hypothetical protein
MDRRISGSGCCLDGHLPHRRAGRHRDRRWTTASLVVSLVAIGIAAFTIIRIKRAEKIGDEFSA